MAKVDDLAEFAKAYGIGIRLRCSVGQLPKPILAKIQKAGPEVSHAAASAWLKKRHSIKIADQTISRHRRGLCRCG